MASEKILIVDDEAPVRDSLVRVLQGSGFQAEGAASGGEALQLLDRKPYDLLLLDIRMPGMTGLDMLKQARMKHPQLSALMLTGYGSIENAVEAMELGAIGFLIKPIGVQKLRRAVEEALARSNVSHELARLKAMGPLMDMVKVVVGEAPLEQVLDRILGVLINEMRADRGMIMLIDREAQELYVEAGAGLPAEVRDVRMKIGRRIAAWVAERAEPVLVPDGQKTAPEFQEFLAGLDLGSAVALPLQVKGRVLGVLNLARLVGKPPFTRSDLEFLGVVSGQVAIAIENSRLYQAVNDRVQQLEREKQALERKLLRGQSSK